MSATFIIPASRLANDGALHRCAARSANAAFSKSSAMGARALLSERPILLPVTIVVGKRTAAGFLPSPSAVPGVSGISCCDSCGVRFAVESRGVPGSDDLFSYQIMVVR